MFLNSYSREELGKIRGDTRVVFTSHLAINPSANPTVPQLEEQETTERRLCFSAYPTTLHAMVVNKFLWKAVHGNGFDANEALELFPDENAVFGIELPDALFSFLSKGSWGEVESALIYTISTIARAEDSLSILEQELVPDFYDKICRYEVNGKPPSSHFRSLMGVFDFIPSLGPWTLKASFLTKGGAENPTYWKLYQDFVQYSHVLCPKYPRAEVLDMLVAIVGGGNATSVSSALQALDCAARPQELSMPGGYQEQGDTGGSQTLASLPWDVLLGPVAQAVLMSYADDNPCYVPGQNDSRNLSMEEVDSALDLDDSEHVHRRSTCRWSLKFMLLEDNAIREAYYTPLAKE